MVPCVKDNNPLCMAKKTCEGRKRNFKIPVPTIYQIVAAVTWLGYIRYDVTHKTIN